MRALRGDKRSTAAASSALSSGRIRRIVTSVPLLRRCGTSPTVRATVGDVGELRHATPKQATNVHGVRSGPDAMDVRVMRSALLERDVVASALARVDLARAGDLLLGVLDHLQPL